MSGAGNKGKRCGIVEYLSVKAELPSDALTGDFRLEIRGRNTLFVHGCRRIIKYSTEEMILGTRDFRVRVGGERLICSSYHIGTVSIEGYINSVCFEDNCTEGIG